MADPISIASFAGSAALKSFKAVRAIALFKSQVSGIDQSVESLHYQVDGISVVLSALSDELKEPDFASQTASLNQSLIRHLPKAIEQCDITLTSVGEKINKLNPPKKRNIAKQTWAAVKLQWSEPEINDLLGRIKGHSMNLQLALMTVSLHNSVNKRAAPVSEQNERFDKLEQMMVAIQERLDQPAIASRELGQSLTNIPIDDSTTALVESAASIISSASTVAGRSTSGTTVRTTNEAAFDYICEDVSTNQPAEGSTTGSELGPPLVSENIDQLTSWIQHTSLLGGAETDNGPSFQPLQAVETWESLNDSGIVLGSEPQAQDESLLIASSDDEDDVDFAVATKLFGEAKRNTEAKDYKSSGTAFTEAFKLAKNFNTRTLEKLDIPNMKILFGTCMDETGEKDQAEKLFSEVAYLRTDAQTSPATILEAQYRLAALKFGKGEWQYAETLCRQVLKNIAKLPSLGKTHVDYYRSLSLLSLITLGKGEPHQAKHYVELLPDERRYDCTQKLNEFAIHPEKRELYTPMVTSLSEFRPPYFQLYRPGPMGETEPPEGIERHIYIDGPVTSAVSTSLPQSSKSEANILQSVKGSPGGPTLKPTGLGKPPSRGSHVAYDGNNQRSSASQPRQTGDRRPKHGDRPPLSQDSTKELKTWSPLLALQEKRHNFVRPMSQNFRAFVWFYNTYQSYWFRIIELTITRYHGTELIESRKTYKLETPDSAVGSLDPLRINLRPAARATLQESSKQFKDPLCEQFPIYPERPLSISENPNHQQTDENAHDLTFFMLEYDSSFCHITAGKTKMKLNGVSFAREKERIGPQDRVQIEDDGGLNFELSVRAAQIQLAGDKRLGYRIKRMRTEPEGDFAGPHGQIEPSELYEQD